VIAVVIGGVLPAAVIAAIAAAGIWLGGSAPAAFALDGLPEATVHNYHFIESEPDLASSIPCYCGCHSLSHRSLLDCYLRPEGGYEQHASGCGICGMEADSVEQMLASGRDPETIRAAIDAEYSSYGKPTDTP
jgi:hypothetical protein